MSNRSRWSWRLYQEVNSEIKSLGARIVAISPELEKYPAVCTEKLNLTFDILTDLQLKTAEKSGLVFVLPDYLRDLYASFGTKLNVFHDESGYQLPTWAVIDSSGIIGGADVNADYKVRLDPSDTVRQLAALRGSDAVYEKNRESAPGGNCRLRPANAWSWTVERRARLFKPPEGFRNAGIPGVPDMLAITSFYSVALEQVS